MAKPLERQGYHFYACERCGFAYKDAATAERCSLYDLENGMRSMEITKESIAPPNRYYQAVPKFVEEEQKAAKAKAAAAAKAAAGPAAPAAPGATPAPAPAAKPPLTPEELEARKKAALEKAAAAKAAKQQAA